MNSFDDIWSGILDLMREKLTPVAISTWFDECSIITMDAASVTLLVPSDFKRGVVQSRFIDVLQ